MEAEPAQVQQSEAEPTIPAEGASGALLCRVANTRSESRILVKMFALGLIPEKRARDIARRAYDLAEKCDNARDFKAAIALPLELMKFGQRERLAGKDANPVNVNVTVQNELQAVLGAEPEYLEWRREQSLRRAVGPALVGRNGFSEQILGPAPSSDSQSRGDAND